MADVAVCETTTSPQKTPPQEPTTEETPPTQIPNGETTTTTTPASIPSPNLTKMNPPFSTSSTPPPQTEIQTEIQPIIDQLIHDTLLILNAENDTDNQNCVQEIQNGAQDIQHGAQDTKTSNLNTNNNVILMKPCSLVPYRISESSDSDVSGSGSEDSESDSTSSGDETESESSASSDGEKKAERRKKVVVRSGIGVKTQGELGLEDLPKIEDLNISAGKDEMRRIGNVHAIVDKLVVVRSIKGSPPLNLETYLFSEDGTCLGQVFEVLGPVIEPYYTLRFNSVEDISNKGIVKEKFVFYVPDKPEMTSFVFVDELLQHKGSDASWEFNNEPPDRFLEYSDDEQERSARRHLNPKRMNKNGGQEQTQNQINVNERKVIWRRQPSRGTGQRFSNPRQPPFHFRSQNPGFRYNPPPPFPHPPRMLFGGVPPSCFPQPPSCYPHPQPPTQQFETSPFLFNPFFQPPPPPPPNL